MRGFADGESIDPSRSQGAFPQRQPAGDAPRSARLLSALRPRVRRLHHPRFGLRRIFFVNHPTLIEQVLHSRNFTKHFGLRMNRLLLGNGLLTSEGDFWLRQRRLIQPVFQRERIAGYGPDMVAFSRADGRRRGATARYAMSTPT